MKFELVPPEIPESKRRAAPQRKVEVSARHDPVTGEWYATAGVVRGVGESLSMALHDLANHLDAINAYGAGEIRINNWVATRKRECQYCGAEIFFAQVPSGKWLPLDVVPLDNASLARGARLACFIDLRDGPKIGFPSRPEGRVWIPHLDVCGSTSNVPEQRLLKERWLANRDRAVGLRERDIDSLRQLARDLGGAA